MTLIITISLDNAAFHPHPEPEIAAVLARATQHFRNYGVTSGRLRDTNGNTVGTITLDQDDEA
jgi:hypothetical protein